MRVLATHSIRQFLLHFPSRASPCATRLRTSSTMFVAQLYEVSVQAMKAYVRGSCVFPLISNLGASWSELSTSLPWKEPPPPPVPSARRLGGPQRQYGRFGE